MIIIKIIKCNTSCRNKIITHLTINDNIFNFKITGFFYLIIIMNKRLGRIRFTASVINIIFSNIIAI